MAKYGIHPKREMILGQDLDPLSESLESGKKWGWPQEMHTFSADIYNIAAYISILLNISSGASTPGET